MWDSSNVTTTVVEKDAVVIGAGISGLATAKSLRDDGFDVIILERTTDIGGLWKFREHDYGVMRFTHINVCKYNYSFSDYPFPESAPDYPHHSQMSDYIHDYAEHFGLFDFIQFKIMVTSVEQIGEKWRINATRVEDDGRTPMSDKLTIVCSYVAIATGHHAKPSMPTFKGEETFPGEKLHCVDFKDAVTNNFVGKRVLVVGIGNSAVDVAVNCAAVGRCSNTYISTRSGAWVFSNYTLGFPTDLYLNRWGLNPKMKILESGPTVSPTLIHHIQRKNIKIVPNIAKIDGSTVHFVNGESADFDSIVYCTGYKMDLPFLSDSIRKDIHSPKSNEIHLYKNAFAPNIGHSLAFIGFIQPASGGLLNVCEMQGRWFSALCKGQVKLPSKSDMEANIKKASEESKQRWYKSARHTIQEDPLVYTDEIAAVIGAKPDIFSHPRLAWRLMLSSGGSSQWRLKGPHKWNGAATTVKKVPIPSFINCLGYMITVLFAVILYYTYRMGCAVFGL